MFIVVNKTSQEIVSIQNQAFEEGTDITQFYPEFDESVMEVAHGDFDTLPEYFDIQNGKIVAMTLEQALHVGQLSLPQEEKVVNGEIVPKSIEELVEQGLVELSDEEMLKDGDIIIKSLKEQVAEGIVKINEPFEFVDENDQIAYRPLAEIVEKGMLQSLTQANMALDVLNNSLEQEIHKFYSPGYESKLMKGYIEWISEGSPEGDDRAEQYRQMQSKIATIKADFKGIKDAIKQVRKTFM